MTTEHEMVQAAEAWPLAALLAADYVGATTAYSGRLRAEDDGVQYYLADGRPDYHHNTAWWQDDYLSADLQQLLRDLRSARREQHGREAAAIGESRRLKSQTGRAGLVTYPTQTGLEHGEDCIAGLETRIRARLVELWPDLIS